MKKKQGDGESPKRKNESPALLTQGVDHMDAVALHIGAS
jgi:hypothetical protein